MVLFYTNQNKIFIVILLNAPVLKAVHNSVAYFMFSAPIRVHGQLQKQKRTAQYE
jgi:hypothetical protein